MCVCVCDGLKMVLDGFGFVSWIDRELLSGDEWFVQILCVIIILICSPNNATSMGMANLSEVFLAAAPLHSQDAANGFLPAKPRQLVKLTIT